MPSGIDFSCDNKDCKHYGTGFTILSPWPIGDIDSIISSISRNADFKGQMIQLRNEGQKFACIQFPNTRGIKQVGWRIDSWCPNCPRIGIDYIVAEEDQDLTEILSQATIPEICPVCDGELKTFNMVLKDGIACPHCKQTMRQQRWTAKEFSEEYNGGRKNAKTN